MHHLFPGVTAGLLMHYWHYTAAAEATLSEGFKDHTGLYLTPETFTGVWASNVPLDEGTFGGVYPSSTSGEEPCHLVVECDTDLSEWAKTYREFLVPAEVLNQVPVRRATEAELDEGYDVHHQRTLPSLDPEDLKDLGLDL